MREGESCTSTMPRFLHIHRVLLSTTLVHVKVFAASIENRYSSETRARVSQFRSAPSYINVELGIAGRNKI